MLQDAKTDAYVMTTYKNRTLKTRVKIMDKFGSPVSWNQEILIPAQYPIINGRLVLKVMDKDPLMDEIVGSIVFDMNKIIKGEYNDQIMWKNIYGCPMGMSSSSFKTEMNNNPEVASWWKGRVLLEVVCKLTDSPIVQVKDIKKNVIDNYKNQFKS